MCSITLGRVATRMDARGDSVVRCSSALYTWNAGSKSSSIMSERTSFCPSKRGRVTVKSSAEKRVAAVCSVWGLATGCIQHPCSPVTQCWQFCVPITSATCWLTGHSQTTLVSSSVCQSPLPHADSLGTLKQHLWAVLCASHLCHMLTHWALSNNTCEQFCVPVTSATCWLTGHSQITLVSC